MTLCVEKKMRMLSEPRVLTLHAAGLSIMHRSWVRLGMEESGGNMNDLLRTPLVSRRALIHRTVQTRRYMAIPWGLSPSPFSAPWEP